MLEIPELPHAVPAPEVLVEEEEIGGGLQVALDQREPLRVRDLEKAGDFRLPVPLRIHIDQRRALEVGGHPVALGGLPVAVVEVEEQFMRLGRPDEKARQAGFKLLERVDGVLPLRLVRILRVPAHVHQVLRFRPEPGGQFLARQIATDLFREFLAHEAMDHRAAPTPVRQVEPAGRLLPAPDGRRWPGAFCACHAS